MTAAERSPNADTLPEYAALAKCTAATIDAATRVLDGDAGATIDLDALTAARDAHTRALEVWTAHTLDVADAARVVDRFTAAFPLRRLSFAAAQLARDTMIAADDRVHVRRDGAAVLARGWAVLRAQCNVRSVRFRNAARAGLGLALAVLVAKVASLEHAFWVVLGALAVLRSNALGTGANALQALAGALVGFAIASALMVTIGGADAWLWIALPVAVFLAAYTPGAVNFVVGQAAFTVFVVVLFNLLVPEGWHTGLVRVQDVAIGAGISVMVGALLWPRGARGVARRTFADLLHAGSEHLRLALGATLDGASAVDAHTAGVAAVDARARAVAALEDLALEHGGGHVDREAWGEVLVDAMLLELASDGIVRAGSMYGIAGGCTTARASLDDEGRALARAVEREADRIASAGIAAAHTTDAPPLAVPTTLDECLATHARDGLDAAVGLVWVHEWLALASSRPR
jgi:uncharacterized membrane protein YccC